MTIKELSEKIEAVNLTPTVDAERNVEAGYACDLLSRVMARGSEGMAWTTVQTHMNVIAVAALHDMACVIIPESIKVDAEVVEKAASEGIAVLSSPLTSFEICGRMFDSGIKG